MQSYIGDDDSKRNWLRESILMWEKNINTISKTAGKYPQESYDSVVRSTKSAWIFIHHVTWYMRDVFAGVEKMFWENVLPRIFFVKTKTLSLVVGALSTMTVNEPGLGLLNPVTSEREKYLSSRRGSAVLIWTLAGGGAFSNVDNLWTLGE